MPFFTQQERGSYSSINNELRRFTGKIVRFRGVSVVGEISLVKLGPSRNMDSFLGCSWVRLLNLSRVEVISNEGYPRNLSRPEERKITGQVVNYDISPMFVDGAAVIEVHAADGTVFIVRGLPADYHCGGQEPKMDPLKIGDKVEVFGLVSYGLYHEHQMSLQCGKKHYLKVTN